LWFIRSDVHDVWLTWQALQSSAPTIAVGICLADLPFAVVPLWQLPQPLVTPVWLKFTLAKLVVLLWQDSHAAVVITCVADLPVAATPL
jgi:hypothetical protein